MEEFKNDPISITEVIRAGYLKGLVGLMILVSNPYYPQSLWLQHEKYEQRFSDFGLY